MKDFSLLENVQTGSVALPFNGTGVLSRQQNGRGVQVNHSPPYSAEVKNEWNSTSAPPACLLGQAKLYILPCNCIITNTTKDY
jgi:hypothetical protein